MEEGQNRQYITSGLFFFCQHLLRNDITEFIKIPITNKLIQLGPSWQLDGGGGNADRLGGRGHGKMLCLCCGLFQNSPVFEIFVVDLF